MDQCVCHVKHRDVYVCRGNPDPNTSAGTVLKGSTLFDSWVIVFRLLPPEASKQFYSGTEMDQEFSIRMVW